MFTLSGLIDEHFDILSHVGYMDWFPEYKKAFYTGVHKLKMQVIALATRSSILIPVCLPYLYASIQGSYKKRSRGFLVSVCLYG